MAAKLVWCSLVETAVRPYLVVLLSSVGNFQSCVEEVPEPVGPQPLFTQPPVEAFHIAVLHRTTWLDLAQLDVLLQAPGKEVPAG
jgi:hypothetical protein